MYKDGPDARGRTRIARGKGRAFAHTVLTCRLVVTRRRFPSGAAFVGPRCVDRRGRRHVPRVDRVLVPLLGCKWRWRRGRAHPNQAQSAPEVVNLRLQLRELLSMLH